jgi:hypothetical protein
MSDEICQIESMESAAEAALDRMTQGLPSGMFRCDCGRVASLSVAVAATPSPYAPPICPLCAEEITHKAEHMSREKHTQGLLRLFGSSCIETVEHGSTVAECRQGDPFHPISQEEWHANARRIVACWNACIDVPTEKLESDFQQGYEPWGHVGHLRQHAELVEALKGLAKVSPSETDLTRLLEICSLDDVSSLKLKVVQFGYELEQARSALARAGVTV